MENRMGKIDLQLNIENLDETVKKVNQPLEALREVKRIADSLFGRSINMDDMDAVIHRIQERLQE